MTEKEIRKAVNKVLEEALRDKSNIDDIFGGIASAFEDMVEGFIVACPTEEMRRDFKANFVKDCMEMLTRVQKFQPPADFKRWREEQEKKRGVH